MLGPLNPNLKDAYPETMFDIAPGTKNGEIFLGPLVSSKSLFSSIVHNPPMPDPIETPILFKSSSSRFNPESITH